MSLDHECDVTVVGAGVVECAIADRLAEIHDVIVLDRAGIAAGATGRAVRPPDVDAVLRRAPRRCSTASTPTLFYGTHGFEFTERRRYDYVPADEAEAARDRADTLAADGFPVSYFDPATRTSTCTPRRRAAGSIGGFARVNPVFQRSFGYLPSEAKVYSFLARAFGR